MFSDTPWIKKFTKAINLRNDVRAELSLFFDKHLKDHMVVYDIGCGPNPFSKSLKDRVKKHVGVDIEDGFYEKGCTDLIGSAYDVPIDSAEADAVISSQVLEHLETPELAIKETARILKKDGLFFCSFPFLYPIHAKPNDYTRFTEYYAEKLMRDHGLEIIEQTRIGGFWYLMGMYLAMYLNMFNKSILKKTRVIDLLSFSIRWLFKKIQSLESFSLKLCKKDPDMIRQQWTVNYVIVAKKI